MAAIARSWHRVFGREFSFEMGRHCDTTCEGEGLACMRSANVRRRSRVEFRSTLRKLSTRVEERRLIARNDKAMYLELVVEVLVLSSLLVGIQYNKQSSCYFGATILSVTENTYVRKSNGSVLVVKLYWRWGGGGWYFAPCV